MKKILLVMAAAILAAACGGAAENKPVATTAPAQTPGSAPATGPKRETLLELEKKAFEAWKNKDAKFFEGFITANFVGYSDGQRRDKAAEIKGIGESKCEVKSFTLSDDKVLPVGQDAAVLLTKATIDATCDGKKLPSPMTSATLFVREGDNWKAAYHSEVAIRDPKSPAPAKPAAPASSAPAGDAKLTAELLAMEKKGWDGWKAQDKEALDNIATEEAAVVDMFGKVAFGKGEVMKLWLESNCDVQSFAVTDGAATSVSKDVAVLTFKASAEGACGGNKLSPIYGMTVWLKEGDAWRAALIVEQPA